MTILFEPPHVQIKLTPTQLAGAKTAESMLIGAVTTGLVTVAPAIFSAAALDIRHVLTVGGVATILALVHGLATYLAAKGTTVATAVGTVLEQAEQGAASKFLPGGSLAQVNSPVPPTETGTTQPPSPPPSQTTTTQSPTG